MEFDVVIIGSGLGGLQCAYILSKEGYKVCILEKNRQFGGALQVFSREKVIFDTGVHYLGGLDEGQNLNRYFKYFGLMDQLNLRKLDEDAFDVISFQGDENEYKLAQGYENFYEQLVQKFPGEKEAIRQYCEDLQKAVDQFPLYNLEEQKYSMELSEILMVGAKDYMDQLTSNEKLKSVLAGNNPLYAGDGKTTPFYMHALITNHYIESSYRCVDGGAQIQRHLTKAIRAQGGELYNYSEVVNIATENKQAKYVELKNGERIYGKHFISNAHPAQTLKMIDKSAIRNSYYNRITALENTISVFILYLVMKPQSYPYHNRNYYHHFSPDVWSGVSYSVASWPDNIAVFFSANSKSPQYADAVSVMAYMDYEEVAQWGNTFHTIPKHRTERSEAYQAFKEQKAQLLIDKLEQRFPGIRQHIQSWYTSTPLSFKDYIGTEDGSLYGVLRDYHDPMRSFISTRSKISNLHFTGENVNMHGILGVTIGSVITCSHFLGGRYLLDKITSAS
jgi:all-trans-retinol 13,14-reductase